MKTLANENELTINEINGEYHVYGRHHEFLAIYDSSWNIELIRKSMNLINIIYDKGYREGLKDKTNEFKKMLGIENILTA